MSRVSIAFIPALALLAPAAPSQEVWPAREVKVGSMHGEFGRHMRTETGKWAKFARAVGAKGD